MYQLTLIRNVEMENKVKTTTRLSAYSVFQSNYDLPRGTAEVTEWSNGQGIDIEIKVGKEKRNLALTYEEWLAVRACTKELIKPGRFPENENV